MGPNHNKTGAKLLVALCLALGACSSHVEDEHHDGGHHEANGQYPVTHAFKTDTALDTEYVAQIRAIQHIELRALERGYLTETFADEGKPVKEGEPMFQIMPMIYQAELQVKSAEAEFAALEYKNTEALRAGNVVSPNELALAKAKLNKAEAERALAKAHLDLTQVRAPFDGIMGRLEVRKGSLLDEGELLTTLADNRQMWVYFNVNEAEYLNLRKQLDHHEAFKVQLRLANGEIFDQPGSVETIEADFNNETGNIAFRATFPNPTGLLRHGETGNVIVSTPLNDVLLIPQKATFDVMDKKFVFVVDEEGVAHLREITVAQELPDLYVVTDGLSEDEMFLLEGLRKVRDGHEVATLFEEPDEVIAKLELPAE